MYNFHVNPTFVTFAGGPLTGMLDGQCTPGFQTPHSGAQGSSITAIFCAGGARRDREQQRQRTRP